MKVFINKQEKVWEVACGNTKEETAISMSWFFRKLILPNELEEADQEFIDLIDRRILNLGMPVYIGYFELETGSFRYPEEHWESVYSIRHPGVHYDERRDRWGRFSDEEISELKGACENRLSVAQEFSTDEFMYYELEQLTNELIKEHEKRNQKVM